MPSVCVEVRGDRGKAISTSIWYAQKILHWNFGVSCSPYQIIHCRLRRFVAISSWGFCAIIQGTFRMARLCMQDRLTFWLIISLLIQNIVFENYQKLSISSVEIEQFIYSDPIFLCTPNQTMQNDYLVIWWCDDVNNGLRKKTMKNCIH